MKSPFQLSIFDTVEPMFIISKFTGYSLFTFDIKSLQPKITKIDIIAIVLTIWLNMGLNCIYWKSFIAVIPNMNEICKISLPILVYLDYIINVASIAWIFINKRKISEMIHMFNHIDDELMKIGGHFDYRKEKMLIIKSIVMTLIGISIIVIMDSYIIFFCNFVVEKLFTIIILWTLICILIQVHHYVIIAYGIRRRVVELQILLVKKDAKIDKISKIHFLITELIPIFNRIFSPIMIMYFVSGFGWSCISIFNIVSLPVEFWKTSLGPTILVCGHCALEFFIVFIVIYAVENVKHEFGKITKISYKILNESSENERRSSEILKFLNQVLNLKIEFTGWIIDFDWKFLFQVGFFLQIRD